MGSENSTRGYLGGHGVRAEVLYIFMALTVSPPQTSLSRSVLARNSSVENLREEGERKVLPELQPGMTSACSARRRLCSGGATDCAIIARTIGLIYRWSHEQQTPPPPPPRVVEELVSNRKAAFLGTCTNVPLFSHSALLKLAPICTSSPRWKKSDQSEDGAPFSWLRSPKRLD